MDPVRHPLRYPHRVALAHLTMLIRVEIWGRYLNLESGTLDQTQPEPVPDNAPQPIVVNPEYPTDPIAARLGFGEEDRTR